jgi:glutamyl-tRNA synthetase
MILGSDKTRLSKRHGATSVIAFRDMGYLPDALLNYLARLGWAHGDKEILSREEMIEFFSIDAVGKSPAVFNPEKLDWLNGHYIRQSKPEDLAPEVKRILGLMGIEVKNDATLVEAVRVSLEKAKTLKEMAELFDFIFKETIEIDASAQKILSDPASKERLKRLAEALEKVMPFERPQIQEAFETMVAEMGIKLKDLAQPARAALSGRTISPGIYESIVLLGKEKTLARLKVAG